MKRRGWLLCLVLGGWPGASVHAATPPLEDPAALQAAIEKQVTRGYDHPQQALATLEQMMLDGPAGSSRLRMLQLGRGLVAAAAGDRAAASQALNALASLPAEPLARADAELVRAAQSDAQGDAEATVKSASAALEGFRRACPEAQGCDWRSSWLALQLLARHEARRGQNHAAQEDAQAALELAAREGDHGRQALSRALAADAQGAQGDTLRARAALAQALEDARASGDPATESRVLIIEQRDAERRGDLQAAYAAASAGLERARAAESPHLVAQQQANLADIAVKTGHADEALKLAGEALPVVRRYGDRRVELNAMHNMALAQVAIGQVTEARKVLDELLAVHHRSGALAMEAEVLREFADAFAAAGDLKSALDLFHRERTLSGEILAANRDAILSQLRARYDREAQQRQLTELERQNALISAQLDNRLSARRIWLACGGLVLAAMLVLTLLVRRVRELNRRLAENQEELKVQSERDPLTGLANRRRLHVLGGSDPQAPFRGAVLLVDVDHFKRINDQQGHAAGDQVLVELARRLTELVRAEDLVVRWGGEEFLILLPDGSAGLGLELAGRVLAGVGSRVIDLPGNPLRVTVSVGFAAFPLPPQHHPVSLERAINLADMALIHAKREGRNRAIGIEALDAPDQATLQRAETDFDQSLREERVTLRKLHGPTPPLAVVGATAA